MLGGDGDAIQEAAALLSAGIRSELSVLQRVVVARALAVEEEVVVIMVQTPLGKS